MTSRLIVHIEGARSKGTRDDGSRDVYWDLENENVTAVLLQNLVAALGPAHGELP